VKLKLLNFIKELEIRVLRAVYGCKTVTYFEFPRDKQYLMNELIKFAKRLKIVNHCLHLSDLLFVFGIVIAILYSFTIGIAIAWIGFVMWYILKGVENLLKRKIGNKFESYVIGDVYIATKSKYAKCIRKGFKTIDFYFE